MRGLDGQVAVVTGAASGIGWAAANRLRQEGTRVVLADIAVPRGLNTHDRSSAASFVQTDVTRQDDVVALFTQTLQQHGRIDILINNAGIPLAGSILNTTEEQWSRVMDVNVKGVYLCAQAAIPYMHRHGGGSIVNVASELGTVGARDCAAYCASKGAVIQLTRAMAIDHAEHGIRVNCVCPGPIETPLLDAFLEATGDRGLAADLTARDTLLGRLGQPDEIAAVIAFLASADASYMTGATIIADGGVTAR
jgi:NAD(P)-dependent dehydrogenase (short-subunit alcohol dehydrogenase family)